MNKKIKTNLDTKCCIYRENSVTITHSKTNNMSDSFTTMKRTIQNNVILFQYQQYASLFKKFTTIKQ